METNSRQERLAKFHLERRGVGVYLPMRAVAKKRPGLASAAPLFPSYLFAQVDSAGRCWADLFASIGVRSVLGAGGKPKIAPVGLIEAIRAREVYGLVQMRERCVSVPHKPGDRVVITRGPFSAYDAIFDEAIDAKRVMVLMSLFDRRTRVAIPLSALKAAS